MRRILKCALVDTNAGDLQGVRKKLHAQTRDTARNRHVEFEDTKRTSFPFRADYVLHDLIAFKNEGFDIFTKP
jgi:hypothetical protein